MYVLKITRDERRNSPLPVVMFLQNVTDTLKPTWTAYQSLARKFTSPSGAIARGMALEEMRRMPSGYDAQAVKVSA